MAVPNTFAGATTSIPLANLDANFSYYDTAYSIVGTTVTFNGTQILSTLTASTSLALNASKQIVSVANTGSGANVLATSPTLVTPILGTPQSGSLINCTFPTLNQNTTGTAANVTGTVAVANGGTGLTTTPANGALDIGNGTGFTRATLTAGTGISVTNASGAITIAATGGSISTSIANGTSNVSIPSADGAVTVQTNGVAAVTVNASQNVGIGTSSPDAKLTIKQIANSTLNGLKIIRSDTTSYIVMYVGGDDGFYIQNQQAGDTIFYNNSAERFRFGSAGQLGVAGANYGTSGQVLTSGGSGAAPTWATGGGYGVGQTLTNYSSSGRAMGTTYTNSTGKPISVMFNPNASYNLFCSALIDGVVVEFQQFTTGQGGGCAAFFIMVPNGSTYQMRNDGNAGLGTWVEWR